MKLHAKLVTAAAFSAAALTLGLSDALGASITPDLTTALSLDHLGSTHQGTANPAAAHVDAGERHSPTPPSITFTYALDQATIYLVQNSDGVWYADSTDLPTITPTAHEAAENTPIGPSESSGEPISPADADPIAGTGTAFTPLAMVALILLAGGAAFVVSGRSHRL